MWAVILTVTLCVIIFLYMVYIYVDEKYFKGIHRGSGHGASWIEPKYIMAYAKWRKLRSLNKDDILLSKGFFPESLSSKTSPTTLTIIFKEECNFANSYISIETFRFHGMRYEIKLSNMTRAYFRYLYCILFNNVTYNQLKSLYYFRSFLGNSLWSKMSEIDSHDDVVFKNYFIIDKLSQTVKYNLFVNMQEVIFMTYNLLAKEAFYNAKPKKTYHKELADFGIATSLRFNTYDDIFKLVLFLNDYKDSFLTYSTKGEI